jgi:hypothetical protein
MKHTFTLLLLISLVSCGTKKDQLENEVPSIDETNLFNTELSISVHIPYCGGARPTQEMANRHKPVEATFILSTENGTTKEVKSDELGLIKLTLPKGKYHLKELSKNVTFETFLASTKQPVGSYIKEGDRDCYYEWWQKNLIDFEITDTTTYLKTSAKIFSHCYTSNPCETHIGPKRP